MRESYPPFLSFLVVLLFLCLLIGPVSASTTIVNLTNDDLGYETHEIKFSDDAGGARNITSIYFKEIGSYSNLQNINMKFDSGAIDSWLAPNSSSVILYGYIGDILVSKGTFGWLRSDTYGGGTFWYDITYWNISSIDGTQFINLTAPNDDDVIELAQAYENHQKGYFPFRSSYMRFGSLDQTPSSDDYMGCFGYNNAGTTVCIESDTYDTSPDYVFSNSKYWANDIELTYSGTSLDLDILRYNEYWEKYFWSEVQINQSVNGVNTTLYYDRGSDNLENIPPITSGPVYITVWDAAGSKYSHIYNFPVNVGITLDKGNTESDSLPSDSATTARLTGTTGNGISIVHWRWSQNFDTFSSGSSSIKKDSYAYKTWLYNSTNVTWELWGYGFEDSPITTTSTTRQTGAGTSGYSWSNVKTQSVQFNWTELDPSWTGSNIVYPYPYNYVYAEVRDSESRLLGSNHVPVYVSEAVDKGYFQIFTLTSDVPAAIIGDTNVWLYDADGAPGVYELSGVNLTNGHYNVLVNLSHTYYLNASKVGYVFMGGKSAGVYQDKDSLGNVTYSMPFPGTKQIELILLNLHTGNYTVAFYVKAQPADLISPPVNVPNAKITITSDQSSDVIYTNANGYVEFVAIQNEEYQYLVEANTQGCYRSQESYFTANTDRFIQVVLDSCTIEPTLTPTPTPTGTPTAEPTLRPEEVAECVSGNFIDNFKCLFRAAGAGGTYAGLMLALVVCAALAFVFGYYISFQASLIGAFVGFVFSLAFGLIPIWILIAMIFIGSLFFISKWWGGSGGG